MKQARFSFRRGNKAAGLIILAVAVVTALPGCSRPGGSTNGAEASAQPTASAVHSQALAAGQPTAPDSAVSSASPGSALPSDSPDAALPGTKAPAAKVLDPAKLQSVFGFADEAGSHILVTWQDEGNTKLMKSLNTAIGNGGQVLSVKFEKWQPGSNNSNGRELANNMANLSGYLFKVQEGTAGADETYYMVDSALFPLDSLQPVQLAGRDAPALTGTDAVWKSIASAKQRKIQAAWKLFNLSLNRQIYLVQFVRQDNNMLFSLILQEDGKLSFMDYPAVIQNNEYSVWRVDDGGEVRPEMFSLLFAAQQAEGLLLGLNWLGAEGVNSLFLSQQGNAFKELDIQYGRYTSPM